MKRITIAVLALLAVPVGVSADQGARMAVAPGAWEAGIPESMAPESWNQQDPADSIYREAREAMNRGEHVRAADLFRRIWERHPRSTYAPDAPYWEAFNRYRTNETPDLERALDALEVQRQRYEKATTRTNGDATALAARIRGILARRGDESSARAVVAAGQLAQVVPTAEVMAMAEEMAMRAQEMVASGDIQEMAMQAAAIGAEVARGAAVAIGGGSGRSQVPEQCRDQVDMQLAALNALIHMNADRALPVLKQVMARRDECAAPIRRRAVFMIADKKSPETVDLLLQAARTDPDMEVRRQAVFWLSEVKDERAVTALEEFLFESQDEKIRERAVFALSQHRSPRARETLRRVVQDNSMPTNLRSKAIFWLGEEGTAQDAAWLKGLFGKLNETSLNERILFAVAQQRSPENAQWLLSVATNAQVSQELRSKAIFWAAEAGAPADRLGDLYGRLQERKLRERVLFALSESRPREMAVEKLIEIARTEKDVELRKKAIFWLSNTNDPRAAEFLMEILTSGGGGGR